MRRARGSRPWKTATLTAFAGTALIAILALSLPALAWDSRTHMVITGLAIDAMAQSPLKAAFERNRAQLEEHSVEPDTVLRPLYGKAEGRRHYIDLENFGPDATSKLKPDFHVMEAQYGAPLIDRTGTLPWAIEDEASALAAAERRGDCGEALRHAGYLAHYVGDASQPLHTTIHFDGYAGDAGVHARLEGATDRFVGEIAAMARGQVRAQQIDSVWTQVIAEIRSANGLVEQTITTDRTLVAQYGRRGDAYDNALIRREGAMIAAQVAQAASVLASIWIYEWNAAGAPSVCGAAH